MRKLGIALIVIMGLLFVSLGISRVNTTFIPAGPLIYIILSELPALTLILLGIFLMKYRETIANRLMPDSVLDVVVDGLHLVRLAVIFCGLLLTLMAVSGLIVLVISAIDQHYTEELYFSGMRMPGFRQKYLPALVGQSVQLIAGMLLLFGSAAISRRIWSIQPPEPNGGTEETSKNVCLVCGEPFDPADYRPDAENPRCSRCSSPLDFS